MLLSLLTANHARATATRLQLQSEEAHLCGMFRNLGEVLIAGHFPDDYQRIRTLMRDDNRTESAATKQVLGFPYVDLGAEVSRHWGLPDAVVQGMRARPAASGVARRGCDGLQSRSHAGALSHRHLANGR